MLASCYARLKAEPIPFIVEAFFRMLLGQPPVLDVGNPDEDDAFDELNNENPFGFCDLDGVDLDIEQNVDALTVKR